MKVCFLITGLLRNFTDTLYPFLLELESYLDFDFFIYTSNDALDTNYITFKETKKKEQILKNPRCKLFTVDNTKLVSIDGFREREQNIFYQWYKLYECFRFIRTDTYDYIVRLRPDIKFLLSTKAFAELFQTFIPDKLYIPLGNDRKGKGINDQFAIGSYEIIKKYADFYPFLIENACKPLVSEHFLLTYLLQRTLTVERINIPYNLVLSDCMIIAIAGDSGVGKSTLLESIQKVFPFDSSLTLETDRYHKWERHDENWNLMTHLNPEANHLEKLVDDTFHLKIGDTICVVDYDHGTGKFTAPKSLEPKEILLLCGLHSLTKERLRNQSDIRIYIDTEKDLKYFWKVSRDLEKRNRNLESILHSIYKRENDFKTYIEPQKKFANLIFTYWYDGNIPEFSQPLENSKLRFTIECKTSLLAYTSHILYNFSIESKSTVNDTILFHIRPNITKKALLDFVRKESIALISENDIDDSYLGLCQVLILCLLT
jgi:uridine kinase